MIVLLTPAAGSQSVRVQVTDGNLKVNEVFYDIATLPDSGPVRSVEGQVIVEYGEQAGCVTLPSDREVTFLIEASSWVDPNPPAPVITEDERLAELLAWRAAMVVDAWQIVAVLGKDRWQTILDWSMTQNFVTQTLVEKATTIPRKSQMVDVMGYLLNMEPEDVDEVFRLAAKEVG